MIFIRIMEEGIQLWITQQQITCGSSDVVKCFVRLPDSKRLTSILHVMNCWNSTTVKTAGKRDGDTT